MTPRSITNFSILCGFAAGLFGCASEFKLIIYNNSGSEVKATWDDRTAQAGKNEALHLRVRHFDPDKTFTLNIGGVVATYPMRHGPIGCWEFPARGGCNVWQLQPDYSIWYLGGSEPTLRPPYPTPTVAQPVGFPMQPLTRSP